MVMVRLSFFYIGKISVFLAYNIGDTDNVCDTGILSLFCHSNVRLSVCPSVTFRSPLGAVITLDGILRK